MLRGVCSYMVEPVRYRKVVVEMMGSGGLASPASSSDTKPHILLTRDQELAISNAVETFEKKCEELRGQREGICEAVKQYRVGRGSELENMRAFIQVRAFSHASALICTAIRTLNHMPDAAAFYFVRV